MTYSAKSKPVVNVAACASLLVTAPQPPSSAAALPPGLPSPRADSPASSISIPSTEKINECSDDWRSVTAAICAPTYAFPAVCDRSESTPSIIAPEPAPASTTAQAAAEIKTSAAVPLTTPLFIQEPEVEPIDPALEALAAVLERLGIGSARSLAQDEREHTSLAELVSSYLDLQEVAVKPCTSGANAATLTSFAYKATLLAVQAGNARLPNALAPLTACLHDAAALVWDDAAPGWLLRGAMESQRHEAYVALHARLLHTAQVGVWGASLSSALPAIFLTVAFLNFIDRLLQTSRPLVWTASLGPAASPSLDCATTTMSRATCAARSSSLARAICLPA